MLRISSAQVRLVAISAITVLTAPIVTALRAAVVVAATATATATATTI